MGRDVWAKRRDEQPNSEELQIVPQILSARFFDTASNPLLTSSHDYTARLDRPSWLSSELASRSKATPLSQVEGVPVV
jgi:hypothetical protein